MSKASAEREKLIGEILDDLRRLLQQKSLTAKEHYAVVENIAFFQSIKSIPKYFLSWLPRRARKIKSELLLELSDLPLQKREKWESILHQQLTMMEKKKFPGMITPLREAILKFIYEKDPKLIISLGFGGMETERQVLSSLVQSKYQKELVIIGVDNSPIAHRAAQENLRSLGDKITLRSYREINKETVQATLKNSEGKPIVLLCSNNIFQLEKLFAHQQADLVFHSKFKHHLNPRQKQELEKIEERIAKTVMEYDDYRSWPLLIPQSIATWPYPVLMNGAVFSRLRDPSKKELLEFKKWDVQFFKIGSYLHYNSS